MAPMEMIRKNIAWCIQLKECNNNSYYEFQLQQYLHPFTLLKCAKVVK